MYFKVFLSDFHKVIDCDFPIKMISSAKKMEEILVCPKSIPRPVELREDPRLLMKRLKSKGERLQPECIKI